MSEPENLPTPLEKAIARRTKLKKQIDDIDTFIKIHHELEALIFADTHGAQPPEEK